MLHDPFNVTGTYFEPHTGKTLEVQLHHSKAFARIREQGTTPEDAMLWRPVMQCLDEDENGLPVYVDVIDPEGFNFLLADVEETAPFVVHGTYAISNAGGYEVEISADGEQARVRECWGSQQPAVSDWLDIVRVDYLGDDEDQDARVIDPEGKNIPLDEVMNVGPVRGCHLLMSEEEARDLRNDLRRQEDFTRANWNYHVESDGNGCFVVRVTDDGETINFLF